MKLSLRLQWILSLTIATAFVVAVIVVVEVVGSGNPATPGPPLNRAVVIEARREAVAVLDQDQQPHLALLSAGAPPSAGLKTAVTAFVAREITDGTISGAIQGSRCAPAAGGTSGRLVFRCTVRAGNVYYPFDGVVHPHAHQIVYCKRDYPPVPTMRIPVSPRCT